MASLLVGKSREDWFDVCNSPGFYRGKGNQQVAYDTEWILSLSYYDLPSHLRTCLLYLSVYPEDYSIEKDSLIWKWIAEGFVEKKTGSSLFQCGEKYFNQLIYRSTIQVVEAEWDGTVCGCRVHDMVLDLIRGLSDEENFVTISNDDAEGTSPSRNRVRRLACHNRMMKQTQQDDHMGTAKVRSLVAHNCDIGSWVLHPSSFKLLRVLALEECRKEVVSWQGLKHLGKLLHLRYLGLGYTDDIEELPEEIGKLKFLQTLDLDGSGIKVLPSGVRQLTQLVCLHGAGLTCVPDGLFLTKLTSLEELSVRIDNLDEESQRQFVKDLGNLREARMLDIAISLSGMVQSDLVQSLGNLHKLQRLRLMTRGLREAAMREWDTVVLPQHLQRLDIEGIVFRQLPSWIDMDEAGLRALGGLPKLHYLHLVTEKPSMTCMTTVPNITAGDGFFEKLRYCYLHGWMVQLVLNEDSTSVSFTFWNGKGAKSIVGSKTEDEYRRSVAPPRVMPNLQRLVLFELPARALYKDGNGGCYNLGLEYLPSLCSVYVYVDCEGASSDDVAKAEAELKVVVELHPNRPKINIERWNEDMMVAKSTDEDVENKMMAQSTDQEDEETEQQEGDVSSAGDEFIITVSRGDDSATPSC